MRLRLTDVTVRALPASPGQLKVWDIVTKGFGVRVNGSSKSWFVMFGKSRRMKILGHYPSTSLADARRAAKEILLGPEERPKFLKFKEAADRFIETQDHLAARSVGDYSRLLKVHFEPILAHKPLNEITPKALTDILDSLSDRPGERKYAHSVIRRFFNWAVARRLLDSSPVEGMESPKPVATRDRVLTDAEVKAIWSATGDGKIFSNIVRLLILTGQRRGEVSQIRLSWLNENELVIPKEATKNGRLHSIPLGVLAKSILKSLAPSECPKSDAYLFPARGRPETSFCGWMKSKLALDKKLGPDFAPWVLHDCRRYFVTTMAKLGVRLEVTEKLVNHISGSTGGLVGIYMRHEFETEKREAIERYESHIRSILNDAL